MFYLSRDSRSIIDSEKRVVGYITKTGKFTQTEFGCDFIYRDGLCAAELEQISEVLQKNRITPAGIFNKI